MATVDNRSTEQAKRPASDAPSGKAKAPEWHRYLRPLASLRLTVVLFLASIWIVLAGTLAQVDLDIWEVIRVYFRVDFSELWRAESFRQRFQELFVWIDAKIFFPPSFFPGGGPQLSSWMGIWFPKGWIIGTLMMLNLFAAHLIRFRIQATGKRLITGTIVLALGSLLTFGVIQSGSNPDGLQADPLIAYDTLWWLMQTTLFGLCGVSIYAAISADPKHLEQRWLFGILSVLLATAAVFAFRADGSNEATMRILYQLIKALVAGIALLAGCIALFKKRAGIVLLHAGIGLMMCYDVLVGAQHVESQMHIIEGETVSFSRDMRSAELAVIDTSSDDKDLVTVVDDRLINKPGTNLTDEKLPFQVEVLKYYKNSRLRGPRETDADGKLFENLATEGIGKQVIAQEATGATGTDTSGGIDTPSAYVKLTSLEGTDLGVYLLSTNLDLADSRQTVTVGGKAYEIALRFKRLYYPYSITLNDVQKNDYVGTDRPKDYSSYIVLTDHSNNNSFEHRIWMNNPMRYAGKTFYQSSYAQLENGEMTTLQVVDNVGWMTPYVACMLVVVGMIHHFGQTLLRFLNRRLRDINNQVSVQGRGKNGKAGKVRVPFYHAGTIVSCVVVILASLIVMRFASARNDAPEDFQRERFSQLPMWYKGRAMPIDTFARNIMLQLSDREMFKDHDGKSQHAILWLMDLMADTEKARDHRVIRIESEEVRNGIGLDRREGLTYSINEINERMDKVIEQASAADKTPPKERSLIQRKTIELAHRIFLYSWLERTFGHPPELPEAENLDRTNLAQMTARAAEYVDLVAAARRALKEYSDRLHLGPLPLIVPTHVEAGTRPSVSELNTNWETLIIARLFDKFYDEIPANTPPAVKHFVAIVDAYKNDDAKKFNEELTAYETLLEKGQTPEDLPLAKVHYEKWYNQLSPFNLSSWLYVFAFVLGVTGWLFLPQVFSRSAFWLTVFILCLHTFALLSRIYISGRPPVTNLYSSAVFIGWAIVLGGLIIESITRLGVGTVVAAIAGFGTLRIAHGLAAGGDTFVVLEAVLDTQFWLATHVVCITLGYATTYLAGLLGIIYVLFGVFTRKLHGHLEKDLTRMIYGILCFATFFSFFGTVLGGLWADDSWGRFWGWDPKENGALIIVLWCALILHARWGGMVRNRGVAVLSILANVVVSWSWFGVNELGVGLHSYGFTEGLLRMLALFALSQLLFAGLGCLPQKFWMSKQSDNESDAKDLKTEVTSA